MKRDNWIAFAPFYLLVVILCLSAAHFGSEAITVFNRQKPVQREHCIVIDAGHGGIDGGATSVSGVLESKINLEIALRLEDLCHFLGYETVMIRRTDESIHTQGNTIAAQKVSDLKERVRIVNETKGGILVSLHQNTFIDSRYNGAQVFYGNEGEGQKLAQLLQNQFIKTINPTSKRKAKPAKGVYLMEHIQVNGVLIECGFLTNPEEDAKLQNPEYQMKICCVIATTLDSFFRGS